MMNGQNFIQATDCKPFYMESLMKSIVFGYYLLLESKKSYNRADIGNQIKAILKKDNAHNELEDYLSTDLVNKYVKPNMGKFGVGHFVVNVGVRETKQNVTVGHLDIKFQVPSLDDDDYYAFEAKRLDINKQKQNYYISGGIERFTERKYYPECNTTVAGMIAFIEKESMKNRVSPSKIMQALNRQIKSNTKITTNEKLKKYTLIDSQEKCINRFGHCYSSKHVRNEDKQEITIFHLLLDYYNLIT